jgi:hypothetical protein
MAFCRIDKVGIGPVERTFVHGHSIAWSEKKKGTGYFVSGFTGPLASKSEQSVGCHPRIEEEKGDRLLYFAG